MRIAVNGRGAGDTLDLEELGMVRIDESAVDGVVGNSSPGHLPDHQHLNSVVVASRALRSRAGTLPRNERWRDVGRAHAADPLAPTDLGFDDH